MIDNTLRDAVLTFKEYVGWVPLVLAASFMTGNVKLPDYGVFEIRTRNTTYKLIRLNGQDQIKGHPKYCPNLCPVVVEQLYLGQPMLLRYQNRKDGRQYVVTSTVFEIAEVVGGSHV